MTDPLTIAGSFTLGMAAGLALTGWAFRVRDRERRRAQARAQRYRRNGWEGWQGPHTRV